MSNKKSSFSFNSHNKKVAKKRSPEWQKKLIEGKHRAKFSPTKLREIRLKKGLSQKEMLEGTNVRSLSTYGQIEMANVNVKKERAEQIAKKLGISHLRLFKKSGKNKYVAI